MTAATIYAARLDAVRVQRARLHGWPSPDDPWGGSVARRPASGAATCVYRTSLTRRPLYLVHPSPACCCITTTSYSA
jgi:hypothetical protein